jgi:hypothetical protein
MFKKLDNLFDRANHHALELTTMVLVLALAFDVLPGRDAALFFYAAALFMIHGKIEAIRSMKEYDMMKRYPDVYDPGREAP